MIVTLDIALFVLKTAFVLCLLAMIVLAADYLYYEYLTWKKRDAAWMAKTERLIVEQETAPLAVERLLEDSRVKLAEAKAKDELRRHKEWEARESFFNEGYFNGFDQTGQLIYRGATAPAGVDWEFYQTTDAIADAQIFENTREL